MKRYTVYVFPSLGGSPRHFRLYLSAWLYAAINVGLGCFELKDNKTGNYRAYWM